MKVTWKKPSWLMSIILLLEIALIIALVVFVPKEVFNYGKVICASVLLVVLFFINIDMSAKLQRCINEVLLILGTVVGDMIFELVNLDSISWDWWRLIVNMLPIYILFRILYAIFDNMVWSSIVFYLLITVMSLANFYVWTFRGQPILPWDFFAFSTAMTVAAE